MTRWISRSAVLGILVVGVLGWMPGCMTVSDRQTIVQNTKSGQTFANRKIAVLPVKAQSSLSPDSVLALRNDVNAGIGQTLRSKLPTSVVTDIPGVVDQLNQKNGLPIFEQLIATYESTGVLDKQKVTSLARTLNADYLLLSRLKAEKMDVSFLSKGMGGSLEVFLVNASTAEVEWAGAGEWKRGGVLGFGGATSQEAASGLVELAFASL